jgi:hypothetical protein
MIKKVEIIPIAERKLTRRGIKRELVENTLLNPTQIVDGYGGRKVAHKKVLIYDKEYLLRVVYEETEEMYTVITTYITSKIDRYWKGEE